MTPLLLRPNAMPYIHHASRSTAYTLVRAGQFPVAGLRARPIEDRKDRFSMRFTEMLSWMED